MVKKAVCIGINYQGTEQELRGCINDADDWARLLGANGFDTSILAEQQATRSNILQCLRVLVSQLQPGDIGFVAFSGHGTWVPDKSGDEPDRRDEALCPVDMGSDGKNLILDDDLRTLFEQIPNGAYLVFVTDCCHSGSLYRLAPSGGESSYRKPRVIPPSHFITSDDMVKKMDRAHGQSGRSNASLPHVIHFSGCKDSELANDTEIGGRACGAFSYYATRAFARAAALGQSYSEVYAAIRKKLPSWEFVQTPMLNATTALKKAQAFG